VEGSHLILIKVELFLEEVEELLPVHLRQRELVNLAGQRGRWTVYATPLVAEAGLVIVFPEKTNLYTEINYVFKLDPRMQKLVATDLIVDCLLSPENNEPKIRSTSRDCNLTVA